jgi:hypothetical protein
MAGRRQAVELANGKERGGGHDELANGVHIAEKGAGRDGYCEGRELVTMAATRSGDLRREIRRAREETLRAWIAAKEWLSWLFVSPQSGWRWNRGGG